MKLLFVKKSAFLSGAINKQFDMIITVNVKNNHKVTKTKNLINVSINDALLSSILFNKFYANI